MDLCWQSNVSAFQYAILERLKKKKTKKKLLIGIKYPKEKQFQIGDKEVNPSLKMKVIKYSKVNFCYSE